MDIEKEKEIKDYCIALYLMYPLSLICQFFETTMFFGLLLFLFSWLFNSYQKSRKELKDSVFENHLRWLLRTFYISTGVFMPISAVIAAILTFKFVDINTLLNSVTPENSMSIINSVDSFMHNEMQKMTIISMITFSPVIIWCGRRYWIGFKKLQDNKPIENITSWM